MVYLPRLADGELQRLLRSSGAVLIEGPKACGKTSTAMRQAGSSVRLDVEANSRVAAELDPLLILDGAVPRLIDEWQLVPAVWNTIRSVVDARNADGQFILTGSAVPADDVTRHSGALRISRMRMRPMSLFESNTSNGTVSLAAVLEGNPVRSGDPGLRLDDLIEAVCRGGWPVSARRSLADAQRALRDYLQAVARTDIHAVDGVRRDPNKVSSLLRSLARNVGTEAAITTLAADIAGSEPVHRTTIADYLAALERLMVLEDQPAWGPHLRSSAIPRKAPKRHFVDPSLAVAALGADPAALRADLNLFGFLFESLVVRDLRVYAQALEGQVSHYRDHKGLEVDAIVSCPGQRWAAFEVKLGATSKVVNAAAANLLRFRTGIDTTRSGDPAALGVIVGSGFGYLRPDGVAVIPIGALGP